MPILKASVTDPQGIFDSSKLYLIKLISQPPTSRPLWSSRLRPREKWRFLSGYWTIRLVSSNEGVFVSNTVLEWKYFFLNWLTTPYIYSVSTPDLFLIAPSVIWIASFLLHCVHERNFPFPCQCNSEYAKVRSDVKWNRIELPTSWWKLIQI